MSEKKYYWLKLKRDFFKRHDMQIIEAMPNGKDYVLFYLKLLVESVDHDGALRFSDTIPYNEQMLATITSTNIDIVRSAMKILTELHMIDVLDDQTIYMHEVQGMLGAETYWAEQKRQKRVGQSPDNVQKLSSGCPNCPSDVQPMSNQEIEIELDKEIERGKKRARFSPPAVEDVKAYCDERHNGIDAQTFVDFYTTKGWRVGKEPMKDWKACVRTWEQRRKNDCTRHEEPAFAMPRSYDG